MQALDDRECCRQREAPLPWVEEVALVARQDVEVRLFVTPPDAPSLAPLNAQWQSTLCQRLHRRPLASQCQRCRCATALLRSHRPSDREAHRRRNGGCSAGDILNGLMCVTCSFYLQLLVKHASPILTTQAHANVHVVDAQAVGRQCGERRMTVGEN